MITGLRCQVIVLLRQTALIVLTLDRKFCSAQLAVLGL